MTLCVAVSCSALQCIAVCCIVGCSMCRVWKIQWKCVHVQPFLNNFFVTPTPTPTPIPIPIPTPTPTHPHTPYTHLDVEHQYIVTAKCIQIICICMYGCAYIYCSALQCVKACCSVLQFIFVCMYGYAYIRKCTYLYTHRHCVEYGRSWMLSTAIFNIKFQNPLHIHVCILCMEQKSPVYPQKSSTYPQKRPNSLYIHMYIFIFRHLDVEHGGINHKICYRVALVSRIDKMIGLFCKRALQKRQHSEKETYNFIDPTNRSHPICCDL